MKNNLIGVTGASGKVGRELIRRGCIPLECDVTKADEVYRSIQQSGVELVIHCAAITDVDYCEKKENEKEVYNVNVRGTGRVLTACQMLGIKMIYISTDHVFDGKRWFGSYKETDKPNPINYYGYSKWAGELVCGLDANDMAKIVRTSFLIPNDEGILQVPYMSSMIKSAPTMIKRTFLKINRFVDGLLYFAENFDRMPKLLHISGTKKLSWYDLVRTKNKNIVPRRRYVSGGFGEAERPQNGGLDISLAQKLGVPLFPALLEIEK